MIKYIKTYILFLTMICIILLSGCHSEPTTKSLMNLPSNGVEAYNISFDKSGLRTYIDIYQTKLLYMEIDEATANFYVYNFANGNNKKISTISNFALKGTSNLLINDNLYFYLSVYSGSDLENILYEMNFSKDEMQTISQNMYSKKLIPLAELDNKIVSLQGNASTNGINNNFVESLDNSGNIEKVNLMSSSILTPSLKTNSSSRKVIHFNSNKNYLYTIEKEIINSSFIYYLGKYDKDFNLIAETNLTETFKKYNISDNIGSFFVFNNYFCITDYSNNSIVCDMGEENTPVILYENDMEYVESNYNDNSYEFFYKRNTNDIYILNTQSGKIKIQNYDLDNNNSTIRVILSYGDQLLIVKQPMAETNKKENIYLIPKSYE